MTSSRPKRHVVLLGAGASVEAGLLTSAQLTQKVYADIHAQTHRADYAQLLAYIIARLQVRNAKRGLSPFAPVDIEDLFDALHALITRDKFTLSEFVERWDNALEGFDTHFDHRKLESSLKNIVHAVISEADRKRTFGFSSFPLSWGIRDFAEALRPKSRFQMDANEISAFLQPFYSSLIGNLTAEPELSSYLSPIIQSPDVQLVATLNYDLTVEQCCQIKGRKFDYGLDRWAHQKRVDWRGSSDLKILKLHGSLNWTGGTEEFRVRDDQIHDYESRVLIFGGGGNKLSAEGPFLQFLSKLERSIFNAGSLLVVGYSFRDAHINAILRRWRLTRRVTNLAVVDPKPPPIWQLGFQDGAIKRRIGTRETQLQMNLRMMECPASEGIKRFFDEPDLFQEAA